MTLQHILIALVVGFVILMLLVYFFSDEEDDLMGRLEVVDGWQSISSTPEGKLWQQIATNNCPDCGSEGFLEGPSSGMSTNIMCANENCGAKFNVTPAIGIAERI